jgi:predicted DsbA family dithiol-disulfide isomerase
MNDPKEVKETFQEAATAKAQGVTGVPFFVFDGRFGVSGAQRAEVLIEALKRSSVPQEPDAPTAKPPAVAN